MIIMTVPRAMKLLLAASALALLSACVAVADSGRRPHPHGWHSHHFYDDAPRWGHVPRGHRHHRHFGAPGRHHSPPVHHRWRRR